MKLFSFLNKKKPVELSPVEYDKLVDSKVKKIQEYVKSNVEITNDEMKLEEKIGEAFKMYLHNLTLEVYATGASKDVVLSPMWVLRLVGEQKKKKSERKNLIIRFFRYLKHLKTLVVLYFMTMGLRREARKIKKLFPKGYINSQTAINLINAVELNKKVMKISVSKIKK